MLFSRSTDRPVHDGLGRFNQRQALEHLHVAGVHFNQPPLAVAGLHFFRAPQNRHDFPIIQLLQQPRCSKLVYESVSQYGCQKIAELAGYHGIIVMDARPAVREGGRYTIEERPPRRRSHFAVRRQDWRAPD